MSAYRATMIRPNAAMTWEDIMADRRRRGLEPRPNDDRTYCGPSPLPAAPKRATRQPKASAAPPRVTIDGLGEIDARDSRNNRPHVAAVYNGPPPKTPAAAAKIRRATMERCACRLCACALWPMTAEEWGALGYGAIRAEHDAAEAARPGAAPDWAPESSRADRRDRARAFVECLEFEQRRDDFARLGLSLARQLSYTRCQPENTHAARSAVPRSRSLHHEGPQGADRRARHARRRR